MMVHGHDAVISSFALARWLLAVLCVLFAYFLGRCVARRFALQDLSAPLTRWGFRTTVAAAAAIWAGKGDLTSILTLAGAALACVLGFLRERKPKPPEEDLTKVIFPNE